MKQRLFAALLAALLILGWRQGAGAEDATVLQPGGMAVFSDCVVTLQEAAWYGQAAGNVLTPMQNDAPSILAIRVQVLNRGAQSRDFAPDSLLIVRYGDAYAQTGGLMEDLGAAQDGLHFVPGPAVSIGALQAKNLVAFVSISPLMYHVAAQLSVRLSIGGHTLEIPVTGAADSPNGAWTGPSAGNPGAPGTEDPNSPYIVEPDNTDPGGNTGSVSWSNEPSYTPPAAPYPENQSEAALHAHRLTQAAHLTQIRLVASVYFVDERSAVIRDTGYVTVPLGGATSFSPPDIPGYLYDHYSFLANGTRQTGYGMGLAVYSDSQGTLDKQQLFLHYRALAPSPTYAPVTPPTSPPASPGSLIIAPVSWDTQFKPGTATAPDGKGDNANVYTRLGNLADNNLATSLSWLVYTSERIDEIPELTAYFNRSTIGAIGIRNGRLTSEADYKRYARLARLRLRVTLDNGAKYEQWIYLPDVFTLDYQVFPLNQVYTGVVSIELFEDGGGGQGFYVGTDTTAFTIHVSDIRFYSGSSAPGASPGTGYSY